MSTQILQNACILLIIASGGLIAERGGILNIGLEGMTIFGAFAAVSASVFLFKILPALSFINVTLALLAAMGAACIPALLFCIFALKLNANTFITGLAVNLLAVGIIPLISRHIHNTQGAITTENIPALPLICIAALVTITAYVLLYHSTFGLRLQIAGTQPNWLLLHTISVQRYQGTGILFSGICAGLGGGLLALRIGAYLPNISAGRGWIALLIIYAGYHNPLGLLTASVLFGALDVFAGRAQALFHIPPTIVLSMPYIFAILIYVFYTCLHSKIAEKKTIAVRKK